MPALLLAGTRFPIAGAILLCGAVAGIAAVWPVKTMVMWRWWRCCCSASATGAGVRRRDVPSGLASLVLAVIPLYVALIEMFLPGGEPLPARGWLGMAVGFAGWYALCGPRCAMA